MTNRIECLDAHSLPHPVSDHSHETPAAFRNRCRGYIREIVFGDAQHLVLRTAPAILITIFLFCAMAAQVSAVPYSAVSGKAEATEDVTSIRRVASDTQGDARKRYQWLFRKETERARATNNTGGVLTALDNEVKRARRLYLSGDTDDAIVTYRGAIDRLESILDDTPPGHSRLKEIERRLDIFDELTSKILGPVSTPPSSEASPRVFHLLEKRRILLRNLAVKKAAVTSFHDVPPALLEKEVEILNRLAGHGKVKTDTGEPTSVKALSGRLAEIRKTLETTCPRYARFRKGRILPLAHVRSDILQDDEMILSFSIFRDRTVVGYITAEMAEYHQIQLGRSEPADGVLTLQERLREYTLGGRSTFMGHAWKEPCRRLYRRLLGRLPKLPPNKSTIFVIPDGPLWYLPLSVLLNPEDQPFGRGRLISQVPSVDMLSFLRSDSDRAGEDGRSHDLVIFESIPWIAEKDMREMSAKGAAETSGSGGTSRGETIVRLILTNPVYPRPSDYVTGIQRRVKDSHAWVGETATITRLLTYEDNRPEKLLLAMPLAMPDMIKPGRQPVLFMAQTDSDRRALPVRDLFGIKLKADLAVFPLGWLDIDDPKTSVGEGPLLFTTALIYTGISAALTNYSNPAWGDEEPFLTAVLNGSVGKVIRSYPRELHRGLDSSFGGKPPAWAGWILSGCPTD